MLDYAGTDAAAAPLFDARVMDRFWGSIDGGKEPAAFVVTHVRGHVVADVTVTAKPMTAGWFWISGQGLRRPVHTHLEVTARGEVTASEPQTGIFGVGAAGHEAIEDLRAALVEHRDVLADSELLSEELQRQKQLLDHFLAD